MNLLFINENDELNWVNFDLQKVDVDLIDTPYEIKNNENSINLNNYKQNITFDNISFSYNKHNSIFNNLNLKIKHSEFLGIVGQTGAGKTTIIKLLLTGMFL